MTPPTKPPVAPAKPDTKKIAFGKINRAIGHRIVLYGPGGIGKTTLTSSAPGEVAFFDLDESLGRLKLEPEPHVVPCASWKDLRDALHLEWPASVRTLVIDSVTKAEELCIAHTIATVQHEKGYDVKRLEDYGYGKGYQHVFETFLPLLSDLDAHCRVGRNVILIAHECVTNVPNPTGDDWIRYEPRLQSPGSGKGSIRLRAKEWADHVLFMGYDVAVDKEGKAKGSGSRTLYTAELPYCMAKSRTTQEHIPVTDGVNIWEQLLK